MSETPARVHVRIEGIVQGVGFRYFTQRHARRLGLKGWVRNRRDGSVEVVAEGPKATLEEFLRLLAQGPSGAWVRHIEPTWEPPQGEGPFTVRPTV